MATVAVYSECDRAARHVRMADKAWPMGPSAPPTAICASTHHRAAKKPARRGASGLRVLSEHEDFAAACRDAGLTLIGPSPEAITLMGSKTAARRAAINAGVRWCRGLRAAQRADLRCRRPRARRYWLSGDGQSRRWRWRQGHAHGVDACGVARRVTGGPLGGAVGVRRWRRLSRTQDPAPRHIEVQLLGDHHGTVLPLSSASARSSAATRRWSRRVRRSRCRRSCAAV